MLKSVLLAAAFLVATAAGYGNPHKPSHPSAIAPQITGEDAEDVSMIQLIANPEAYNGKTVRVIGFLHLAGNERAIYLHNEDFLYGITKDSLSIDVTGKDVDREKFNIINHQYVTCTARFVAKMHSPAGSNSGALANVTTLELWGSHRGATPPPLSPESAVAAQKRSYVVIEKDPILAGLKGETVVPGDEVAFNVYFKQVGPSPVELGGIVAIAYLRDDSEVSTEEGVAKQFMSEVAAKHKEWDASSEPLHHPALGLGTSQFATAFAEGATSEPLHYTQEILDGMENGSKTPFVLLNVPYKDMGAMHEFHLCMLRQKNGVWRYCSVYNDVE